MSAISRGIDLIVLSLVLFCRIFFGCIHMQGKQSNRNCLNIAIDLLLLVHKWKLNWQLESSFFLGGMMCIAIINFVWLYPFCMCTHSIVMNNWCLFYFHAIRQWWWYPLFNSTSFPIEIVDLSPVYRLHNNKHGHWNYQSLYGIISFSGFTF